MIKIIESWNIPKYVEVNASLEPMSQKLTKTTIDANFRQHYLVIPSLPHQFFWVDLIDLMTVLNLIIHQMCGAHGFCRN